MRANVFRRRAREHAALDFTDPTGVAMTIPLNDLA
jgi:hypothetical protein